MPPRRYQTEANFASFFSACHRSLDEVVRKFNETILVASKRHISAEFVWKKCLFTLKGGHLMLPRRHVFRSETAHRVFEIINTISKDISIRDEAQSSSNKVVEVINYQTTHSKIWKVTRFLHSQQVSAFTRSFFYWMLIAWSNG